MLQDPAVVAKIADTKAAGEVRTLESFYTMLQIEPAKAFYGKRHVEKANDSQAVETLLISDSLFRCVEHVVSGRDCSLSVSRCKDLPLRKEYVKLVDSVKESGGEVKIFSSMHISGERKFISVAIFNSVCKFTVPARANNETKTIRERLVNCSRKIYNRGIIRHVIIESTAISFLKSYVQRSRQLKRF